MAETFILLDQQNGAVTTSPGTYQVAFSEPLLLKQGAQLQVSDAYVDARQVAQGAFEFPADLQITIELAYSMYNFTVSDAPTWATELAFLCKAHTASNPNALHTRQLHITIPAGVYSAVDLAQLITREASKIPDIFYGADFDFPRQESWYKPPLFFQIPAAAPDVEPNAHYASQDQAAIIGPLGDVMSGADVGTTQFALEFTGTRFSFTGLHRPCLNNSAAGPEPCVYLRPYTTITGGPVHFNLIPYVSAVHLYDLRPASFWESLGFTLSQCTIKPNLTEDANMSLQTFLRTTTRGFAGIDALPLSRGPNWNDMTGQANWPTAGGNCETILTTQVQTVDAAFPPQYDSDGFFLLDVRLLPARANTITSSASLNTSALVSRVLTSQEGYAFSVSSIQQLCTSDCLVGGAQVTILSAATRQPYTGLGVRNSVILKLVQ